MILRITWQSFVTVQRDPGTELDVHEPDPAEPHHDADEHTPGHDHAGHVT